MSAIIFFDVFILQLKHFLPAGLLVVRLILVQIALGDHSTIVLLQKSKSFDNPRQNVFRIAGHALQHELPFCTCKQRCSEAETEGDGVPLLFCMK